MFVVRATVRRSIRFLGNSLRYFWTVFAKAESRRSEDSEPRPAIRRGRACRKQPFWATTIGRRDCMPDLATATNPMRSAGRIALALALCGGAALADEAAWRTYAIEGNGLNEQGRYADAERAFRLALTEAETFSDRDPRLAWTLNHL